MTEQSASTQTTAAETIAADELVNAAFGPAVRDAIDMRITQITQHGHTREKDADLPIDWLPREAAQRALAAVDRIRGTQERRNLPAARLALLRVAALCLAAVDRLDLVIKAAEDE